MSSRLGTSPAFQLYAADLLADHRFRLMTMAERGLLLTMLCELWVNASLPALPASLARLLGVNVAGVEAALPAVMPFFEQTSLNGEMAIVSPQLEAYRSEVLTLREARSKGGKMRAEQMHGKPKTKDKKPPKPASDKGCQPSSLATSPAIAHGVGIGVGIGDGVGTGNPVFREANISSTKNSHKSVDPWIADYMEHEAKGNRNANHA